MMTMQEYLDFPAVSASVLIETLDRCPAAAWFNSYLNPNRPRETSDVMDAGTIAHSIVLEGNTDGVCVIDPEEHPAEKTGAIPTGWTNKSIKGARDIARAEGLIPVLKPAFAEIVAMVRSTQAFISSLRESEPAIWSTFQPDGGASEQTFVWQDGPTQCKIRPDQISTDKRVIVDLKFTGTSAEPDYWGRAQMIRMQHYVGAAFYRRGILALHEVEPAYVYLVTETSEPYLCSLVGVDGHAFDLGAQKVHHALTTWRECVATAIWPGYPARVAYPEIPGWEDLRWTERNLDEVLETGLGSQP